MGCRVGNLPSGYIFCTCSSSKISASRQEFDESARSSMKRRAFVVGVSAVAEGYKEPALSGAFAFAFHDGFEGGDIRATDPLEFIFFPLRP